MSSENVLKQFFELYWKVSYYQKRWQSEACKVLGNDFLGGPLADVNKFLSALLYIQTPGAVERAAAVPDTAAKPVPPADLHPTSQQQSTKSEHFLLEYMNVLEFDVSPLQLRWYGAYTRPTLPLDIDTIVTRYNTDTLLLEALVWCTAKFLSAYLRVSQSSIADRFMESGLQRMLLASIRRASSTRQLRTLPCLPRAPSSTQLVELLQRCRELSIRAPLAAVFVRLMFLLHMAQRFSRMVVMVQSLLGEDADRVTVLDVSTEAMVAADTRLRQWLSSTSAFWTDVFLTRMEWFQEAPLTVFEQHSEDDAQLFVNLWSDEKLTSVRNFVTELADNAQKFSAQLQTMQQHHLKSASRRSHADRTALKYRYV
eukprot:TRINITY_DN7378_c0_g1_i2.p1 TRINITY_DN7378_c0_g1~~TRINITY_DN7378_c0_g1_i2.p1  ORF type:complete len:369 (-),score=63.15 TRINITY_DN7378_c0_g1_i2:94-1200(-)